MDLASIPQPQMQWDASNPLEAWKKLRQHVELSKVLSQKKKRNRRFDIYFYGQEKRADIFRILGLSAKIKVNR